MYSLLRPLFFCLDAERAHNLTIAGLKSPLAPSYEVVDDAALKVSLWDKNFSNPIGLAAGFDKNAEVIAPILSLGFGFTEVGTVTPKPQDGNPKQRVFRAPKQHAVINRMGFPNKGLHQFQQNLTKFLEKKPRPNGIVGLNIGPNKDNMAQPKMALRDYIVLIRTLAPMADYLTVNISSPNTPGLRNFQKPDAFRALMTRILDARAKACGMHPPPLLVKLAPDLTKQEQEDLAKITLEMNLDGLILSNTTLDRPRDLNPKFANQKGGLSGKPVFDKSTEILKSFYRHTQGKIPLIGVGGIETASDAYRKIRAGASLVQLYTGMVYQGPSIAHDICKGLAHYLERDGFSSVKQAVGIDVNT